MAHALPTLSDYFSRLNPDRGMGPIVEVLEATTPIIQDIPWREGNLTTGHKSIVRSGLPTGTWRKINSGVEATKSTTVQVVDTTGMLEAYSKVDVALANLESNAAAFRASEDAAFTQGLGQQLSTALIYGNTATNPEQILGLAPRYGALTGPYGDNIINEADAADLTSIWLVTWGEQYTHGIYPKGSRMGFTITDRGQLTMEADDSTGLQEVYVTHFKWDCGLCVRDWRYNVRICNIDVTDLVRAAATGPILIDLMVRAIHKLPNPDVAGKVFYVNEDVMTYLDLQTLNSANMNVSYGEDEHGRRVVRFRGIPVRKLDSITASETAVA